jgi:hypothetical protein
MVFKIILLFNCCRVLVVAAVTKIEKSSGTNTKWNYTGKIKIAENIVVNQVPTTVAG